jgi:TRAP-type C4-dicarboxylate transport system permease large subunit
MVFFILTGGLLFGHFMAISRIPFVLTEWLVKLPISPLAILIGILLLFFISGFFVDGLSMLVVVLPIFFPVIEEFGFDPIWFGVILVLQGEMGLITPPVGVNVFVIKGIAPEVPLGTIYRGIFPFLYALIVATVLLFIFPQIVTYLPSFLTY